MTEPNLFDGSELTVLGKNETNTDAKNVLAVSLIKQYLKEHLSISVNVETNDFMSTDGSTRTRVTVSMAIDGEEICSDSYTS